MHRVLFQQRGNAVGQLDFAAGTGAHFQQFVKNRPGKI